MNYLFNPIYWVVMFMVIVTMFPLLTWMPPEWRFPASAFMAVAFVAKLERIRLAMISDGPPELRPLPASDPLAFERFCAAQLTSSGWACSLTPRSGDFGADIIATRGGETLAVQCKSGFTPSGVSAVQEIVASRAVYRATRLAVVSTGGFTPAAERLAKANGVALLSTNSLLTL